MASTLQVVCVVAVLGFSLSSWLNNGTHTNMTQAWDKSLSTCLSALKLSEQQRAEVQKQQHPQDQELQRLRDELKKSRQQVELQLGELKRLRQAPVGQASVPAAPPAIAAQDIGGSVERKVPATTVDIRVFVVTYNSDDDVFKCLDSILGSDITTMKHEVVVLNNFGYLARRMPKRFHGRVIVLDNPRRPDWSTGHLARDWNQCLVNGFQDLDAPRAKMVVCMQADNEVAPAFATTLQILHKKFMFINAGIGDAFCSYTPEAVKTIGLYDERYSNIGWQDFDYLFQAIMHAGPAICCMEKTITYDKYLEQAFPCGRQPSGQLHTLLSKVRSGYLEKKASHSASHAFHYYSETVFREKWPMLSKPGMRAGEFANWGFTSAKQVKAYSLKRLSPAIPSFILYPYFEKNVNNSRRLGLSRPWKAKEGKEWQCARKTAPA